MFGWFTDCSLTASLSLTHSGSLSLLSLWAVLLYLLLVAHATACIRGGRRGIDARHSCKLRECADINVLFWRLDPGGEREKEKNRGEHDREARNPRCQEKRKSNKRNLLPCGVRQWFYSAPRGWMPKEEKRRPRRKRKRMKELENEREDENERQREKE